MNKRIRKKNSFNSICKRPLPRKKIIKRIKACGFSGYCWLNICHFHPSVDRYPFSKKSFYKAYKNIVHNNMNKIWEFANEAINFDVDWLEWLIDGDNYG